MASGAMAQGDTSTAIEEIVVTGVTKATNQLDTSISVSALNVERIENLGARSTSEIYRSLPGIRSESSAGGGNANIGVRGLPIVTGGAQFISQQEDGLPITLFGDMNFAPADGFIKVDSTLARIESVRGGTASTLSTNGNGAIINLIQKTGKQEGGSIQLTKGVDYRDTRVDAEFGARIDDTLYFHVGGHYQIGGDYRNTGFDAVDGGKFRASITKEFDNGFFRIYGQFIDKKEATFMPQATGLTADGRLTDSIEGLSANSETLHSSTLFGFPVIDANNNVRDTNLRDGFHTKSTTIGSEFEFEVGDGFVVNNKFRYAQISGGFVAPFTHAVSDADTLLAGTFNGASATFLNGPNAGAAVTSASLMQQTGNNLITEIALFDTEFQDMGHFANDLRVSKTLETDNGSVDFSAGYFVMRQDFVQDWSWGRVLTSTDNEAAIIDVDGVTESGVYTYSGAFGGCCNNFYDLQATVNAPYAMATYRISDVTVDASVRHETMDYSGYTVASRQGDLDVNGDGVIGPAETGVPLSDPSTRGIIDDNLSGTAYSFGANYGVTDDLSVFARYSRGITWNFDRQLGAFNTGSDGSIAQPELLRDETKQWELGLKWSETDVVPGNLDVFVTYFNGRADLNNFSVTTNETVAAVFDASGIELEFNYNTGAGFNFVGNVTWTDADINENVLDPSQVGNKPRRQADWVYNFTPSYTYQDIFTIGANINGTSDSYVDFANNFVQPGFTTVGLFTNINVYENVTLSINANNVFDVVGYTEGDESRLFDTDGDGIADTTIARSITGRTISASIRYRF
jgi:outer membrane receptor protein involved in Fe transport